MSDLEQAARQALEALNTILPYEVVDYDPLASAIAALRQALEQKQEPFEYWNAVEGWVKIDELRQHFDSVGCGTIYKTAGEGRVPLYIEPPKQEPVAWMYDWKTEGVIVTDWVTSDKDEAYSPTKGYVNIRPLYIEPPKREWVGLTDEEVRAIDTSEFWNDHTPLDFARVIEAKLKEKNT